MFFLMLKPHTNNIIWASFVEKSYQTYNYDGYSALKIHTPHSGFPTQIHIAEYGIGVLSVNVE